MEDMECLNARACHVGAMPPRFASDLAKKSPAFRPG